MDMNWRELKSVVHFVLHRMETTLQHFLQQVTQTNSGMVDMNTKLQEQMAKQSAQINKLLQ